MQMQIKSKRSKCSSLSWIKTIKLKTKSNANPESHDVKSNRKRNRYHHCIVISAHPRATSSTTKVINFYINTIFDTPSAHCAHGQERISAQRTSAHWALVWLADWSGENPTMAGLLGYGERLDGVSVRRARVWRAVFSCLPIMWK